jgi:hypothetical protein
LLFDVEAANKCCSAALLLLLLLRGCTDLFMLFELRQGCDIVRQGVSPPLRWRRASAATTATCKPAHDNT